MKSPKMAKEVELRKAFGKIKRGIHLLYLRKLT
jgi:hypothetical protein